MELEHAIAQVRTLIAERDEIDRKLGDLLALGPKPMTAGARVRDTPPSRKEPKKRKCSICDQPGHNVATCPQGKRQHPNNPPDEHEPDSRPLTDDEWAEVRARKRDGDTAEEIADACSLPLTEVNAAYNCPSYFTYKRYRLRGK